MQLITGKTKLLGIIGDPVEHSLSPVMHNAAIANLGLDYVYIPFPVKQGDLARAIAGFSAVDLLGFSITIPHKQDIIPLLTEVSDDAVKIGAVNTVWRTETGWKGKNTDVAGFVAPLKTIPRDWSGVNPVVLGNGGAARAVIVGLINLGCPEVHVVGRNPDKLARFYQSWQHAPSIAAQIKIHNWDNLSSLLPATDLLVNSTPVGMSPKIDASPIDASLMGKLKKNAIAYDLIYTPNPTQFLKLAKDRGAIAIDGLEMLVQQGVEALEIWLDRPIPVEIMRNSLKEYLGI
ncbi:shikimate dehydrogenase [Waterburya agarophytonicola K14]|uniref:Shikimate dehydrogenase (NADP(+)) n=1 Tax=Waterburya agarophytonicola KI4 TaxID=2874699 RepID=A0A964FF54_9CYAN|nr:shikimate dehydrogenase [Waterburya agarophytonicola]MCC0177385.1 shikimate dehydrogenase [Waterburya agarophytonicola KI4]